MFSSGKTIWQLIEWPTILIVAALITQYGPIQFEEPTFIELLVTRIGEFISGFGRGLSQ